MKNLKKKVVKVLAGVFAITALAGCGQGTKNTGLTEDGKVLLEITTPQKEVNEKSYNANIELHREFESYYAEKYPDSTEISIKPHYYAYNTSDYAAVALGGGLPTYYGVPLTDSDGIVNAGYAKDISKWMDKYGYLEGMDDRSRKTIERDGKIYMLPYQLYSVGIAVNLDLLEKAGYVEKDGSPHQPETFEELLQMAKNIKEKTGVAGLMMPTMANTGGWRFTPIAWAYGVDFMEQEEGQWKATFNSAECIEALQLVKDMKWKYDILPENILLDESKVRNAFGAGEAAMVFTESGSVNTFVAAGLSKDNIGYIHMPAGPKRHVTLVGGANFVFNKDATDEQIDAAFEYLDWIGYGRTLNDSVKERMKNSMQEKIDNGQIIGLLDSSPYDSDAKRRYQIQLIAEMANIDANHVKYYNDQSMIEWQYEEPVECQALYAVLDNIIQAVLADENADCAKLVEEACITFQSTLDIVNNS